MMMSDISEIESKIKALREEANKRAASLINVHISQDADHASPGKESMAAEYSEALATKEHFLSQAQGDEAVLEERKEKIDALTRELDRLETRINELRAVIAEKDELIVTLTMEKLQLEESVNNAEKSARNALETSRAWQTALTEEINAHAVAARDRDLLLTEIEQLEGEIQRHAEATQVERHEQDQVACIQAEHLGKEPEYYDQTADHLIKDRSIDGPVQETARDGEFADHADTLTVDPPQCELAVDILEKQEHPGKQAAKAWQNKVEEYLAISNNGSIRWDRNPGEREGMTSRARVLESNVRKLAESSMAGVCAKRQPAENTILSGASSIGENKDVPAENKPDFRKQSSIVAGLSTVTVVFLGIVLSLAAGDGETAFAQPFAWLFGKSQSGAEKTHQGRVHPGSGDHQLQPQEQSNGAVKQKPTAVSANDRPWIAVDP
jgi:hypothetical protein